MHALSLAPWSQHLKPSRRRVLPKWDWCFRKSLAGFRWRIYRICCRSECLSFWLKTISFYKDLLTKFSLGLTDDLLWYPLCWHPDLVPRNFHRSLLPIWSFSKHYVFLLHGSSSWILWPVFFNFRINLLFGTINTSIWSGNGIRKYSRHLRKVSLNI